MVNKTLMQAIKILGSQKALASAIEVKQQNISSWLKTRVPAEFVIPIEKATKGNVSRHQLRLDIYPLEDNSCEQLKSEKAA